MTTHTRLLILAVMTCALPMTAMAQDSVTQFRLKQDPKNIYLERSVPISMTIPAAAPSGLEGEQQVETEEERAARQAEGERYVASAETIEARRRAEDAARLAAAEEERRRRQNRE